MVSSPMVAMATMLLVAGIVVLVAASKGVLPTLTNEDQRYGLGMIPARFGLGFGALIALYLFTAWPVAGFYGFVVGFLAPSQWLAKRRRHEAIERVEAIAGWVETLRDTMAASAGLQEALRLSGTVAPPPIRSEVRSLAARLQHQSVPQALRRFAGEMKHPLADQVVASLILATMRSAGSLRPVLAMTSAAARDTASMWRQVEAGRSSAFQQARLAAIISLGIMSYMVAQNRAFLEPFDTVFGQCILFLILGAFLGSGVVMYRMGRPVKPERIFDGIEHYQPGLVAASRSQRNVATTEGTVRP